MKDDGKSGSSFDLQTALIVLALVGGAYLIPFALRSARPQERKSLERTSLGDQVVPARLWQDPLEVALAYRTNVNRHFSPANPTNGANPRLTIDSFFTLREIASQISRRWTQASSLGPKEPTAVLEVMISGGSYAEDSEERHRTRYAVLSALEVAGYVASDPEHLGYAEVPWLRGEALERRSRNGIPPLDLTSASLDSSLIVPYEWFSPNKFQNRRGFGSVLVLWLNADDFEDHPSKRLAQFNQKLRDLVETNAARASREPNSPPTEQEAVEMRFKLIDPRLENLLDEDFGREAAASDLQVSNALKGLELYSSWSTTADALVSTNIGRQRRVAVGRDLAATWGTNFFNATCTDDELAEELVDELALRGVDVTDPEQGVVLVSEWDTLYGRALPLTFQAVVKRRMKAQKSAGASVSIRLEDAVAEIKANHDAAPSNIIAISYLRGVDGQLPGNKPKAPPSNQSEKGTDGNSAAPRPEGDSQLDYLPRLAGQLENLEDQRKGKDPKFKLKAIGVLGSDAYDKLLVIQMLRREFTSQVYFTTDLDARVLHPEALPWTRNLVVASSFGLQLNPDFQRGVPPFRDTYETGDFLATLAALNYSNVVSHLDKIKPRLFEIGRNGPFDLSTKDTSTLQPENSRSLPSKGEIGGCLALIVLAGFVVRFRTARVDGTSGTAPRPRREAVEPAPSPSTKWIHWVFGALVFASPLLILGLFLCICLSHANPQGEPFSWTDGVSLWPAELIRACAACLSLYFLHRAYVTLRDNKAELRERFDLPRYREGQATNAPDSKEELCMQYDERGFIGNRLSRLFWSVGAYVVLAAIVYSCFPAPFCPFRGRLSFEANFLVLLIGGSLQTILCFFVVDASLLCRSFIEDLIAAPDGWPPQVCHKFMAKTEVSCGDLDAYIDVNIIAVRTKAVSGLIFYPFIILFLMIISRTNYFARWDWPYSIIIIFGLNSALALYAVWSLRNATEKLRSASLAKLKKRLLEALSHPEGERVARLKFLIEETEGCDEGAFAPISQQPLIKALLMPFGGAGVLTLVDYFTNR